MSLEDFEEKFTSASDEEKEVIIFDTCAEVAARANSFHDIRRKPYLSTAMCGGEYMLCSAPAPGPALHKIHYWLTDREGMLAFGSGDSIALTVDCAKVLLAYFSPVRVAQEIASRVAAREKEQAAERAAQQAAWRERNEEMMKRSSRTPGVPRRRQRIFNKSDGKCHYCQTPLTLTGKWHIEHKMPRALMGSNKDDNLVASCAPCNHKKRDMTDVEFMASRGAA